VSATDDGRLRAVERSHLILELQDIIVHQLSNVSLQIMSQLAGNDPRLLRDVLRRVGDSTESALAELRLLVRVGRELTAAAPAPDAIAELSQRLAPTAAAARWAERLLDAGFEPLIRFAPQADDVRMTVQGTLLRALDTTATNILEHAPGHCRCAISLRVNAARVLLEVTSPLSPVPVANRGTRGESLRRLRARVELTGGAFCAGPSVSASGEGEWAVRVLLPRD
jgi:signal transduction histidine kinase